MELELLPDHVLIKIFQSLGNYDLLVCRGVCTRWFNLLKCKKYFDRVHRLKFSYCTLSVSCPPLSVFKSTSSNFFTYLLIEIFVLKDNENQQDWNDAWKNIGGFITYLYLGTSNYKVLGNGSNWVNLSTLKICNTEFPSDFRIPCLKKLIVRHNYERFFSTTISQNFPNLLQLCIKRLPGEVNNISLSDWELKRLRKIQCWFTKLHSLKTDTIEKLTLFVDEFDPAFSVKEIELFLSKQKHLREFGIECYDMVDNSFWFNWTQLTHVEFYIRDEFLVRNCLVQLKNLKRIVVYIESEHNCFFGHEAINFPYLKYFEIVDEGPTNSNCEVCWKTCFESFSNANEARLPFLLSSNSFLYLLRNLNILQYQFLEFRHGSGDVVDDVSMWSFRKNPSVVELDCSESSQKLINFQKIAEMFPNLRKLKICLFDPVILRDLPALEHLKCYFDENEGGVRFCQDIVQFGKNLRVLQVAGVKVEAKHFKYLFDNIQHLLKIYHLNHEIPKVYSYTRSSDFVVEN